jgi:hypothetical protein
MTDVLHRTTAVSPEVWRESRDAHATAADELTAGRRARRATGERHPVWDFMFTYYPVTPGQLRRWSPGAGTVLRLSDRDDSDTPRPPGPARFHKVTEDGDGLLWQVDTGAFRESRGRAVEFVHRLLRATAGRPAQLACFGMHEWAMVYRGAPRHPEPLRLGAEATDRVVEGAHLRCTHIDAYRFFTAEAAPRNALHPTRETQVDLEQPGCLHATMDLYKWATKLGPLVPGELWLDTFRLACDVRRLDMEASPYDLSAWGFDAVPVETPEGRSEYARRQRDIAAQGQALRHRMLDLLERTYPDLKGDDNG